jgi:hypothetical protein
MSGTRAWQLRGIVRAAERPDVDVVDFVDVSMVRIARATSSTPALGAALSRMCEESRKIPMEE